MQSTLERPAAPTRHRFDVDDYYRIAEAGILSREDRVELIEGEVVNMAPIGGAHALKVHRLNSLVGRPADDGKVIASVQSPPRPWAKEQLLIELGVLETQMNLGENY